MEKRKEIVNLFKKNKNWLIYIALIVIIVLAVNIRTSNLGLLKDVTTNDYIPVALDPHVFLRYIENIVENRPQNDEGIKNNEAPSSEEIDALRHDRASLPLEV